MDLDAILKQFPGMSDALIKQQGKALQAQIMEFLALKAKGQVRFREVEAANLAGIKQYLAEHQARILNWSVVPKLDGAGYVLLTEEVHNA